MESWRHTWRKGVAPLTSTQALEALRTALINDDPNLLQKYTTDPNLSLPDWPCKAGCPVAYCGMADGLTTVGECEQYFARVCHEVDMLMGEPAAIRWFTNWADDTPREEMRKELLTEVERSLSERYYEQAQKEEDDHE